MLNDLLTTPEAQTDPYTWAAVFVAHWAIGFIVSALLARYSQRLAPWVTSLSYLILWEGSQLLFFSGATSGALVWDSILDWVAVTLGALVSTRLELLPRVTTALLLVASAGYYKRKMKNDEDKP